MEKIKEKYIRRKNKYKELLEKQTKANSLMSNLRLLTFLAGVGFAIALFFLNYYFIGGGVFLAFAIVFIYLIVRHEKLLENKKYSSILCEINEKCIKRLEGQWRSFADTGEEFVDESHNYSHDLDIFGDGSLFQYINAANTELGRHRLKDTLAKPCKSASEIYVRQEAIGELAEKLRWRQRFAAEGLLTSGKVKELDTLFKWAVEKNTFYTKPLVIFVFRALPVLTALLLIFTFTTSVIPYFLPLLFIVIQLIILKVKSEERSSMFAYAEKYKNEIKVYYRMLKLFERAHFSSEFIKQLKNNLVGDKRNTAFQQVDTLSKLMDSISNRFNIFYFFFNLFTLWDYQCLIALERWKEKSGCKLYKWFDTIGVVEELSSLAIIKHDNPEWAIPKISENQAALHAIDMGHPLLTKKRVNNDLKVKFPESILLITGSNMSGKSTLLRTAGINLALAYAGAPVCAKSFSCSIMDIYSCMRVSDNLEKNVSSFYAELLRIKNIVKATEEGKQVFFLLDEIFKGTNSKDRHTGARILIKKLSKEGAFGLVSTHDLELGDLEEESRGRIRNYHFREYYKGNEIYFDYKLNAGISTTRNAIYLMKLAGIDIDNQ